jgi:DNA-binding transcriptional ArsR family regulator
MNATPDVSVIAGLIGDPARASMLDALMDGRALTAKELAYFGGITPQTASSHLAKLTGAGLIRLEQHGRNRYYRLASTQVAEALEAIMVLAAHRTAPRRRASPVTDALRAARTCYDHLAGNLGVSLANAMLERGVLLPAGRDFALAPPGVAFFAQLGVNLEQARRTRRALARQCLDWTERRIHLGGALGAALATRCLERGWVVRADEGRAVHVTPEGRRTFSAQFGLAGADGAAPAHGSAESGPAGR